MLEETGAIAQTLTNMTAGSLNLVFTATPLLLLEIAWPRGRRNSMESRLRSAVFWAVWIVVGTAAATPLTWLIGHITFKPWITDLTPSFLSGVPAMVVAGILAVLLADFVQYWVHRAQHSVPFLWRFHAVHHSVQELGAVSYYRHWGETTLSIVIYGVPMSIITGYTPALPFLVFALGVHGAYLHTATGLHFGWGNRILNDNRFHRIHHSLEPAHFNKNFTNQCPIWDWMFGTAYFPKPDEWPATGVEGFPEPQSILDFLLQPFRAPPGQSRAAVAASR